MVEGDAVGDRDGDGDRDNVLVHSNSIIIVLKHLHCQYPLKVTVIFPILHHNPFKNVDPFIMRHMVDEKNKWYGTIRPFPNWS